LRRRQRFISDNDNYITNVVICSFLIIIISSSSGGGGGGGSVAKLGKKRFPSSWLCNQKTVLKKEL
jgi:hypothetical protein